MPAERFVAALNQQIGRELAASHQYVAAAVYYDALTLPRLAGFFYRQAVEERNHAMMMVRYLLDTASSVAIPAVEAPVHDFPELAAPVRLALEQERRVADQVGALLGMAREESDFASEQFMQWFVREQVEEVSSMSDLLEVMGRESDRPSEIEEYLERETLAAGEDPTAPTAAGGTL